MLKNVQMGWFGVVRFTQVDNVTIRYTAMISYSFFENYASIVYRFRDTTSYLSKFANFDQPHLHLAPPLGVTPVEFRKDFWRQKTRVPGLSCGVVDVILRLAVLL